MLFDDAPIPPQASYRVLARVYRPKVLQDLVGQKDLVKTLTTAIDQKRLPHAFLFTGIRGVGKTSTARILARSLNCEAGPTVTPCGVCSSCRALDEDRHMDVIEMDAASRTSVDDIREVIDSGKYRAVTGRYKIFIIDEAHMLSKSAFNALLKTLEEPPPHLIFILATTEIEKVPQTILSRCTKCSLKRIDQPTLRSYFLSIAEKENATLDTQAADLIARAADGSVRDGLSILDQAITACNGSVSLADVQSLLGLMDKHRLLTLFELLVRGQGSEVLLEVRQLLEDGADPTNILEDLLDLTHSLTVKKTGSGDEGLWTQDQLAPLLPLVSMTSLMDFWRIGMQGLEDVVYSPLPQSALEMTLIKAMYRGGAQTSSPSPSPSPSSAPATSSTSSSEASAEGHQHDSKEVVSEEATSVDLSSFESMVEAVVADREALLAEGLKRDVRVVSFRKGQVILTPASSTPTDSLMRKLGEWLRKTTDEAWSLEIVPNAPAGTSVRKTMFEADLEKKEQERQRILSHPMVRMAVDAFPDAVVQIEAKT